MGDIPIGCLNGRMNFQVRVYSYTFFKIFKKTFSPFILGSIKSYKWLHLIAIFPFFISPFILVAASVLKAVLRYGKKQFVVDETRRDTYKQPVASGNEPPVLATVEEFNQLIAVGTYFI